MENSSRELDYYIAYTDHSDWKNESAGHKFRKGNFESNRNIKCCKSTKKEKLNRAKLNILNTYNSHSRTGKI